MAVAFKNYVENAAISQNMSESGRNPLNKSTVNYLIVRYYERYTKNKSLVDFFRGFSVDDRIFLRTKRDLFMGIYVHLYFTRILKGKTTFKWVYLSSISL